MAGVILASPCLPRRVRRAAAGICFSVNLVRCVRQYRQARPRGGRGSGRRVTGCHPSPRQSFASEDSNGSLRHSSRETSSWPMHSSRKVISSAINSAAHFSSCRHSGGSFIMGIILSSRHAVIAFLVHRQTGQGSSRAAFRPYERTSGGTGARCRPTCHRFLAEWQLRGRPRRKRLSISSVVIG